MTPYDVLMIGVVIGGMVWGALRGITWQVASIASLVLGYAVAYPVSGQLVSHFPGEPIVARALSLLVVYAAVSGSVFLAAWLVRTTLRQWKFEAYDRHLGMILGGAEGALVGMVATVFVVSLAPGTRQPILTSHSGQVVSGVLSAVQPVLPGEVRTMMTPFWTGVAESTPAAVAAPTLARDDTPESEDSVEDRKQTEDRITLPALPRLAERNPRRETQRAATPPVKTPSTPAAPAAEPDALRDLVRRGVNRVEDAAVGVVTDEIRRAGAELQDPATTPNLDPEVLRSRLRSTQSRVGRAVTDAIGREIEQTGERYGRDTPRR